MRGIPAEGQAALFGSGVRHDFICRMANEMSLTFFIDLFSLSMRGDRNGGSASREVGPNR